MTSTDDIDMTVAFFGGGGQASEGVDFADNISLAATEASTSAGTFLTRYTNRSTGTLASNATRKTSRNKRREERKRARGKKGSVYEEEYLVNSIGRLVERVNELNDETVRLVEGLMRRGMRERAVAVENSLVEVLDACKGCLEEVFQKEASAPAVVAVDSTGVGGEAGGEEVEGAPQMREAPVIKAFARLSLIGS